MVVHRRFADGVRRAPHVKAVLATVVESQTEQADLLHPPREVLGVLEDRPDERLGRRVVHAARATIRIAPSFPVMVSPMLLPIRSANPAPNTSAGVSAPAGGGPAAATAAVRSSSASMRKPARFQQLRVSLARLDERRRLVFRPGQGIGEVAVADPHLLVHREEAVGPEHTTYLCEDAVLLGDVHADVVDHRPAERAVVVGHRGGGTEIERHLVGEPDARGQVGGDIDEVGTEVDPRDLASVPRGRDTRRTAEARAHVEERRLGTEVERFEQVVRRRDEPGVKLVDPAEILDRSASTSTPAPRNASSTTVSMLSRP